MIASSLIKRHSHINTCGDHQQAPQVTIGTTVTNGGDVRWKARQMWTVCAAASVTFIAVCDVFAAAVSITEFRHRTGEF